MALQIAGLRANESNLPDGERVFNDPYAELFFPEGFRKFFKDPVWLKAERAKYEEIMPGVNGAIVARIRFIDECLEKSVKNGLKQLVIIGAGYDTRALRIETIRGKRGSTASIRYFAGNGRRFFCNKRFSDHNTH